MRPRCAALTLSVFSIIPLASTMVQAGPPEPGLGSSAGEEPLVGRLQMRDARIALTRGSLAADGAAAHLAPAVAKLMAEASELTTHRGRASSQRH